MADQRDLEFTYSLIDRIFRLSLGELADFRLRT
jgi:cyclopropane-fatty-acyl-phospholipid synthase